MKLALLSNVTTEVLAGMLRKEHDVWLPSGFGAWMETCLSIPEDLKAFEPEAVFLLLDRSHASYDSVSRDRARSVLEVAFPNATVLVPDLDDLAAEVEERHGGSSFCDERMWKLGSMPWSMIGLRAIQDEINRLCSLMRGGARKVLALDFDNTLWDGVIGEDGVAGIRPRVAFQREVKALQQRGVLLVGLTKNNEDDVNPVWSDPRMVLKREDFVDLRANWEDKPVNLVASAKALNLGSDAYVFLDDNPAERAQMRACCPEVSVPDWPVTLRRLARHYFPPLRTTAEDGAKTAQYQAEAKRAKLAEALSLEDYLGSLDIRVEIHPIVEAEFPRVAQLSQKSNQFNVCTNRYSVGDVARLAADPSRLFVTLHAADRFGDLGLVAFVHLRCADSVLSGPACPKSPVCEIVDWVMSCRAMNRRLEFDVQRWLEEELRKRGVVKLRSCWRKTAKNAPVRDLFERFGFRVTGTSEGEKRYERILV